MTVFFPEYKWDGFIDNNCREVSCNVIIVVNLEQFAKRYRYRTKILISNMANTEEIIGDLLKTGVYREDIYILSEFDIENMKDIYFLPECMERLTDDDGAFIDIGCYDGKDSLTYLRRKNNKAANIYAFEPDRKNYELCKKNLAAYPNVTIFSVALSDVEEELCIEGKGEMVHLDANGDSAIWTQLLDNVIPGK